MEIAGGYRTIEKTGIARSPSFRSRCAVSSSLLSLSLSPFPLALSPTGRVSLRSSTHKSGRYQLLGPSSQKILITKYDIIGASPAKYNTMFMQRIKRCCEIQRGKYRPRWDRRIVRRADSRAGLLQRRPGGAGADGSGARGPGSFRSSVLISPR